MHRVQERSNRCSGSRKRRPARVRASGAPIIGALAFGAFLILSACSGDDTRGPDRTPPGPVGDLHLEPGAVDSSVVLVWTAPGDDGDRGQATRYDIRISMRPSTTADWFDSVATPVLAPIPAMAGQQERWPLSGLFPDSTYYARLRAEDDSGNLSELSNEASSVIPDLLPPAAIVDLRIAELTSSWIELAWSAPGDDGNLGQAERFDLRVSDAPIDPANWDRATPLPSLPAPGPAGASHTVRLDGLFATRTYYYAIRAVDEAGLLSPLAPSVRVDTPTIRVVQASGDRTPHPDLRSAIEAAAPLEIIDLGAGTFTGDRNRNLELGGKALTIRGVGNGETVIDPERAGRAFLFSFPEESGAFLQDVAFRNGLAGIGLSFGGAAFCRNGASPTFLRCLFQDNEAISDGGAIAARSSASPRITDCEFQGNRSATRGGAVAASDNSRPGLWGTTFSENWSEDWGGAVWLETGSSAEIVSCTFQNNETVQHGGALACDGSAPLIRESVFASNRAGGGGGAVLCFNGSAPEIVRSRFFANTAARWAGAIYCWDTAAPEVIECVFGENEAQEGGAFLCWINSSAHLSSCTLVANRARFGTAIRAVGSDSGVRLDRSILAFGVRTGGSAYPGGSVRCEQGAVIEAACTLIYGNEGGDWIYCLEGDQAANGNLWEDPFLCDALNRDYQLRTDSPCVDADGCGQIGAYGAFCPPPAPGKGR